MAQSGIPITILTGFLGSGKTRRLSEYLRSPTRKPTAVIVNEYGAEPVDGDLIIHAGDGTPVETTTGCVCCSISGDVRSALFDLADRAGKGDILAFEQMVIETTGIADPASLVHAVAKDERLSAIYRLSQIICVVDAVRGEHWLERFDECQRQVALADRVILSKLDLIEDPISQRECDRFVASLQRLNPTAEIVVDRDNSALEPFLHAEPDAVASPLSGAIAHSHPARSGHRPISFSILFEGAIQTSKLEAALLKVGDRLGHRLLRAKGVIAVAPAGTTGQLIQIVGGDLASEPMDLAPSISRLVFIVEDVDPREIADALTPLGARLEQAEAA
ncbi:MAG: GTP-binding protein [Pseudomonadota bacterium]